GGELVDDDLSTVGKISELRLPHDQNVRVEDGVAVLEADHRHLREWRVVHLEGGLRLRNRPDYIERLAGGGVVDDEVAMAEGAALHVLPREADGDAFGNERGKGERFGVPPVDAAALAHGLSPPVEELGQPRVGGEAFRS